MLFTRPVTIWERFQEWRINRMFKRYLRSRDETIRLRTAWAAMFIVIGLLLSSVFGVRGQEHEHPPEHMPLHDRFYSTWMKPGARNESCCNKQDCFPTVVRIRGTFCEAYRPLGFGTGNVSEWVKFDCQKLEENQPDGREAPDGQSHACLSRYSDTVYCAVRGSGQ